MIYIASIWVPYGIMDNLYTRLEVYFSQLHRTTRHTIHYYFLFFTLFLALVKFLVYQGIYQGRYYCSNTKLNEKKSLHIHIRK
jgi:hypothetical protein